MTEGSAPNRDPILMLEKARGELAPTDVLRAGINMSNVLLVTGKTPEGHPDGVSCSPWDRNSARVRSNCS